jgi:hypothetical protein
MTLRPLLTRASLAALATLALSVLAQTPTPTPAPSQALVIPPHSCVAPEYPTKEKRERLRGDAYNRAIEAFNRDNKAYGECIRKYVEDTKALVKAAADAGNKAIDEYNKYTADMKKTLEEEKD